MLEPTGRDSSFEGRLHVQQTYARLLGESAATSRLGQNCLVAEGPDELVSSCITAVGSEATGAGSQERQSLPG